MDFGRYRLVKELGRGGMAIVSRAVVEGPLAFSRELVIKRILPELARETSFVHMLATEARLSARLRHPGIVQVYEFGHVDGEYYLAMELVDGSTLSALMRACQHGGVRVPVGVACFVVSQVAAALAYAHALTDEQGRPLDIVHRDVSPTNVMLTPFGATKLLDFGIAKAVDRIRAEQTQTEVGAIRGKISYLSPEQADGRRVDRRSDLFSLGVIFHELLTLQPLFRRGNDFETLRRIRDVAVSAPSQAIDGIPSAVDTIVMQMLARDPDERFPSGDAVVAALAPVTRQLQVDALTVQEFLRTAPVTNVPAPTTPRRSRSPLLDGAQTVPLSVPSVLPAPSSLQAVSLLADENTDDMPELIIEPLADPLPALTPSGAGAIEPLEEQLLGAETIHQPTIDPISTERSPRLLRPALVWLAGVLTIGLAADVVRRLHQAQPTPPAQVQAQPAARPRALEVPELTPPPAGTGGVAAPPEDAPAVVAERQHSRVRLSIAGPIGADLFVDGERAGKLPFRGKYPRATGTRRIEVTRPGYRTWSRDISADTDVALVVGHMSRLRGNDSNAVHDPFE